jgi:hypothetical protein
MNECTPKYEPGQDLTGYVTQAGGVVGKVVPVRCSIALGWDVEVEAAADGTAVPLGTSVGGRAIGRTFRSAAINTDALVELY